MKKVYFLKNGGKPVNMGDVIQITHLVNTPFGKTNAKFDVTVTRENVELLESEGFLISKVIADKKPRETKDPIEESVNLLKQMGILPKEASVIIVAPSECPEDMDKMQKALHKIFSVMNGENPNK